MTIWRNEQLHIVARLPRSSSAYEAENIQLADVWRVSNRSRVAHGPALPSRANYRKPWSGHPDDILGTHTPAGQREGLGCTQRPRPKFGCDHLSSAHEAEDGLSGARVLGRGHKFK